MSYARHYAAVAAAALLHAAAADQAFAGASAMKKETVTIVKTAEKTVDEDEAGARADLATAMHIGLRGRECSLASCP